MNIIIPIGGTGKRFANEGYRKPKPLINVLGKPIFFWNLEHLRADDQDTIYIVYRQEFSRYHFEDLVAHQFSTYNFRFIPLANDTRGASETVLYALNDMTENELEKLTIVVDADNFYLEDILAMAKSANRNLIFYKKDYGKNPIYSYILTDGDQVLDIKEKVKISDNACVGAYCFENGLILGDVIRSVIAKGKKQLNEFYVSSLYSYMLHNGISVYSKEISDFVCLGTPRQVRSFSSRFHDSRNKYRSCLALFDTLVTSPGASDDLEEETGFYHSTPSKTTDKIEVYDNQIIKYSNSIEVEKYYYEHIPEKLKDLFPELLGSNENSIRLSKVTGIPLSFLNVNRTLTESILLRLLETLDRLHSFPVTGNVDLYPNHYEKVKDRLSACDFEISPGVRKTMEEILGYLKAYELNDKGIPGMIHGDPVLTNILIDADDNIKMTGMRGRPGEPFSVFGDIMFDYGKVYQSLAGYDFILMDKPLDKDYIEHNKRFFENYISSKFGKERLKDITFITKSLLLSLTPIHKDDKGDAYYELISEF